MTEIKELKSQMYEKLIEPQEPDVPDFGFITALALFLEHKNFSSHVVRDNNHIINDLRLYGATDHLLDMEIPRNLPSNLRKTIQELRTDCLAHRMDTFKDSKFTDDLFRKAEDIMASIELF